MTTEEITNCRDYKAFCKLKRKDLIEYIHSFGITETDTAGLVKNLPLWDLRNKACYVMKKERKK